MSSQHVLYLPDASSNIGDSFGGEWDGHQVIEVTIIGAITQVLTVCANLELIQKMPQFADEGLVKW